MDHLTPVSLALTCPTATNPALAANASEALATRAGRLVAWAGTGGVSDDELVAVGEKVLGWARQAARDAADLQSARAICETAAMPEAAPVERTGQGTCEATVQAFRELEWERR